MKSFLKETEKCVDDFIDSLIGTHSFLMRLPGHPVVLQRDLRHLRGKVALLSGGGAGHEPAHLGYVGRGMLTGAISGAVFTSPPASSIYAMISTLKNFDTAGILLIVTNYTGDKLNFGLAKEWAKKNGLNVEMIVIGEDCAQIRDDARVGKRGLAGTVLIHKIAGALAEKMEPLEKICSVLTDVLANIGTISICLEACTLPGAKTPSFSLAPSEMELGVGIHGERGVARANITSYSSAIELMLDHMTDVQSKWRLKLREEDELVLLINNLGGMSVLELGVITNGILKEAAYRGWRVCKVYSGSYMTSLQMVGFSITALRVSKIKSYNTPIVDLLTTEAHVPNPLINISSKEKIEHDSTSINVQENLFTASKGESQLLSEEHSLLLKKCIISSCQQLLSLKDKLNEYDSELGDGDCGTTNATGAQAVLQLIETTDKCIGFSHTLHCVGVTCSQTMGGSTGALYGLFFATLSSELSTLNVSFEAFSKAFQKAVNTIEEHGGATVGDRSLIDVLNPVGKTLTQNKKKSLKEICLEIKKTALKAAELTTGMVPKVGRASYVKGIVPRFQDPGAYAVSKIIVVCTNIFLE